MTTTQEVLNKELKPLTDARKSQILGEVSLLYKYS